MDTAQHSAGKTLLESVRLGDLPGIGMTVIDGEVRSEAEQEHAAGDESAENCEMKRQGGRDSERTTLSGHIRSALTSSLGGLVRSAKSGSFAVALKINEGRLRL